LRLPSGSNSPVPPSSAPTNHLHHHHLHTLKPINNSVALDQTASHTYYTPITMADREQPYDPYIPSGGAGGQQAAGGQNGNMRTAALQAEIDSTVGIMRDNINKVSERGARLDSLQDKTDNLAVSAQGFRRGANRVRKQMWWKDMKMRMCLIVGIIILLIVIIVPSVVATQKK